MTPADIKTMELKVQRTISATPADVYEAWLDPENPGSPWNNMEKLMLNPVVDGLFYRMHRSAGQPLPHFGRFTALEPSRRIQHTWMSLHTRGLESVVTVTFERVSDQTIVTIRHANLPDDDVGRVHAKGWNLYLDHLERGIGVHRTEPAQTRQ